MDELRLSKRLKAVALLVKRGNIVADIGTDHGYLPIYLAQQQISPHIIAMDVRKGPLSKAESNLQEHGAADKIELRLSNGLDKINKGEADTVTICGMGGKLIQQILTDGMNKLCDGMQLIFSPQSEVQDFRIYLKNNNIHIMDEIMIKEDNQYYVIMDCCFCSLKQKVNDRYGSILLEKRDPVLKEFLLRELELNHRVLEKLKSLNNNKAVLSRYEDLKEDEIIIKEALKYFE